jgi:excisionase family DNA binding protein
MSQLYSVEQVANRLGLHVRTVRGYIREGRLKAVRIGKQYRIAATDLEAFTGRSAAEPELAVRTRHAEVSSIVEISAIAPDAAGRLTSLIMAAASGRPAEAARLRIDAGYDETRAHLKFVITGGLATVAQFLGLINLHLEQAGP